MVWNTGHAAAHNTWNFTHPDDQFDQFMFVLRISIFEMTALFSCTSNTLLDINWSDIGGERWFGMFAITALMISQFTASTEILYTIRMTNLINICSFLEYRHLTWRHCSRRHRKFCWIKVGFKLVEKGGLEFLLPQHLWSVHSEHRKFTHPLGWWPVRFIYVRSKNIDARNDGSDLMYIEYFPGYKSAFNWWSKMVRNFRCNSTGHAARSPQQAPIIYTPSWWPIRFIYLHSKNIDILHVGIDLVYIEYYSR